MNLSSPAGHRVLPFLLSIGAIITPNAAPVSLDAVPGLRLNSVTPQALMDDAATELTVTGTGFLPETAATLVGGGAYEIGQLGNPHPLGLASSGDHAFLAGLGLTIVDLSQPASPRVVGQSGALGFSPARAVAVAGDYAYVSALRQSRMRVVDVSDPSRPRLGPILTTCSTSRAMATDVALYLTCREGRLLVADLSDPAKPAFLASAPFGAGPKIGMAMKDDRLFVLDEVSGFFVLDIRDPLAPVVMGEAPDIRGMGVTVDGHFAYVAGSDEEQLQVVDVQDAERPVRVGVAPTQNGFDDPVAGGGLAFTGNDKRLWIYDTRTPWAPTMAYTLTVGTTMFDVERAGHLLAVADQGGTSLRLFDVSRPEVPGLITQVTDIGRVAPGLIVGNRAYLRIGSQGAQIVDISVPGRPRLLKRLTDGELQDVEKHFAYLTKQDRLDIWDVRRPQRPVHIGTLTAPSVISDVAVEAGVAYVGLDDGRVLVVDVAMAETPVVLATIPPVVPDGRAWSFNLSGTELVYLLDSDCRNAVVQIVDVGDPADPRLTGYRPLPTTCDTGNLAVKGTIGFRAASGLGLQVIDLSRPADPKLHGTLTGFEAGGVVIDGTTAIVSGPTRRLMFDFTDPLRPRLAGGDTWSSGTVGTSDHMSYLAGPQSGLQVVRVNPLVPEPTIQAADRLTLLVPPGLSPGFYHVMALRSDGQTAFLYNAVQVLNGSHKPLRVP